MSYYNWQTFSSIAAFVKICEKMQLFYCLDAPAKISYYQLGLNPQ